MAFDLSSVALTSAHKNHIIVVYGGIGVGKTTFAVSAPRAILLRTEDGTGNLTVPAFPIAQSLSEVIEALDSLRGEHEFQTVVIDSLDHLEPLIWAEVCRKYDVDNIEKAGGGYGKGYNFALDEWRVIFDKLANLRESGMHVVLVAHSQYKKHQNPELDDVDRAEIKLQKLAGALCLEKADAVLYAKHDFIKTKETVGFGNAKTKARSTGERILCTIENTAFSAKNRFNLPAQLPLSWKALDEAINHKGDK